MYLHKKRLNLSKKINAISENVSFALKKDESILQSVMAGKPFAKRKSPTAGIAVLGGAVSPSQKSWQEKKKDKLDRELDMISKKKPKKLPLVTDTAENLLGAASTTSMDITDTTELSSIESTEASPISKKEELKNKLRSMEQSLEKQALSLGLVDPQGRPINVRPSVKRRGNTSKPFSRGRGGKMVLDLRPTIVRVADIPIDLREESILRSHFEQFGEISNISFVDDGSDTALVQFKTRHDAETACERGSELQSHKLKFTWYNAPITAGTPVKSPVSSSIAPSHLTDMFQDSEPGHQLQLPNFDDNPANYEEDTSIVYDDEDKEHSWKR